MKVAFAGKGGTGKTTLSALFIQSLAGQGREVLAVDCDPDSNLGIALGFKDINEITPVIEMEELIRERMGVSDDGTFFKLNPKIDDIPDKFARSKGNIKLIVMGAIKKGGSGCACPENAFVKNLMEHLVLKRGEDVVMDMEAGVEHFGRGTAQSCDAVLIVAEPSQKSLESARRIQKLAEDLRIKKIYTIANKIKGKEDIKFITDGLGQTEKIIGKFPYSEDVIRLDKTGDLSGIKGGIRESVNDLSAFLLK